ncbi:MAG: radical SAM protein, partial [Candidatus Ranarchaeia archaeon]
MKNRRNIVSETLAKTTKELFNKIQYTFDPINWNEYEPKDYGLYLHVPFCSNFCLFCPFYKVPFEKKTMKKYLETLEIEIRKRSRSDTLKWFYIGGGTPNLLTIKELKKILTIFSDYYSLKEIGMEGNVANFNETYLEEISSLGINKISMGVETLRKPSLKIVNRKEIEFNELKEKMNYAKDNGIIVNVDLMIGLPNQSVNDCLKDAENIAKIFPNQITTYPFMTLPGIKSKPSMIPSLMNRVIEDIGRMLTKFGYQRNNIWIFSKNNQVYDSTNDESKNDYLGFGPGAFSMIGNTRFINPSINSYFDSIKNDNWLTYNAEYSPEINTIRKLAHEFYDLHLNQETINNLPKKLTLLISLMRL